MLPYGAANVINKLESSDFEGYVVGGCVRDFLMNIQPKDYDVTTNATTNQIKQVFENYHIIETGLKHGTVTVISDELPIEITTYRIDGNYSDGRHPDSVSFTGDIREDLARRDFTMNSIAYSPKRGFVDAFGGRRDIANRVIKCVGDPDKRFGEDALRILRALRFASVMDFAIDPKTAEAIHCNKHLLCNIVKERITSEFIKLICGVNAANIMREYSDVIVEIIPPIDKMFGFEQQNPCQIYDVWEHTLHVVENVPPKAELRLAALLHDIGKPHCFTVDQNGGGHLYNHAKISDEISQDIFKKYLRLPNITSKKVCLLVINQDIVFKPQTKILRKLLMKFGEETLRQLLVMAKGDVLGQSDKGMYRLDTLAQCESMIDDIIARDGCFSVAELAVNGSDLINEGIPQGKKIGIILRTLLDEINDDKLKNEKSSLLKRAYELNNGLNQEDKQNENKN